MHSKGYQAGQGLGKNKDGITTPVKVSQTSFVPRQKLIMYVGSSMIGGVKEHILSEKTNERVKVHSHPGATIQDVKDFLIPHLRRKPTHLILQVGTNDARKKDVTADDIYNGLMDLKKFAESVVQGIHVTISCPMVRSDNKWANNKLLDVTERLKADNLDQGLSIMVNDNISYHHLGARGLHLKQTGTDLLSDNACNLIMGLKD
jgi:hypothetical protein